MVVKKLNNVYYFLIETEQRQNKKTRFQIFFLDEYKLKIFQIKNELETLIFFLL